MSQDSNRLAFTLVIVVSFIAMAFLFWLIYFKPAAENIPQFVLYLPWINASLNSLSAFFLTRGFIQIKKQQIQAHQKSMIIAFLFSAGFLTSYIIYHHYHGDTRFLGTGWIRPVYFFILISHILLSVVTLPLVLWTFTLAGLKKWNTHKKVARWTFPLWLYVSVSGVLVVFILKLYPV